MPRRTSRSDGNILKRAYTRKDGTVREYYEVEVTVATHGDGQRERVRRTFQKYGEAKEWRDIQRARRDQGVAVGRQVPTVGQLLDQYVQHGKTVRNWSPSHTRRTMWTIDHELAPLKQIRADELTVEDVEAVIYKAGAAPDSVRLIRAPLVAALNLARKRKRGTVTNVASEAELPEATEAHVVRFLKPNEVKAFIPVATADRLGPCYLFSLFQATRPSETVGLRWEDVDFEGREVRIRQVVQQDEKGNYVALSPKTKKSRRTMPLADEVVALLKAHRQAQLESVGRRELVFTNRRGEALHEPYVNRHLQAILKAAGLPTIALRELRHTGATLLLARGNPVEVVQEWLGHTSILTTRRYAQVVDDALRAAADSIDTFLASEDRTATARKGARNAARISRRRSEKVITLESKI